MKILNLYLLSQWIIGTGEKGRVESDPKSRMNTSVFLMRLQCCRDVLRIIETQQSTRETFRFRLTRMTVEVTVTFFRVTTM